MSEPFVCVECGRSDKKHASKGRCSVCKSAVYEAEQTLADPEGFWLKMAIKDARRRAKKKGADCASKEELFTALRPRCPKHCPILGIKLDYGFGHKGKASYNSPSLDRVDSNRSYTPDNVRVVSWRANALKKNGTLEEFRKIVTDLETQRIFDDLQASE